MGEATFSFYYALFGLIQAHFLCTIEAEKNPVEVSICAEKRP